MKKFLFVLAAALLAVVGLIYMHYGLCDYAKVVETFGPEWRWWLPPRLLFGAFLMLIGALILVFKKVE